jgi:hypothetical protein
MLLFNVTLLEQFLLEMASLQLSGTVCCHVEAVGAERYRQSPVDTWIACPIQK